jgi:hypothetical protein
LGSVPARDLEALNLVIPKGRPREPDSHVLGLLLTVQGSAVLLTP